MPETGVPFIVDASNVVLVEDLNDIPVGEALTVRILLTDLRTVDVPTSMTFVAKANPNDSDVAPTSVIQTITTSLASTGVILPTTDPTVWEGIFQFTRRQGARFGSRSTYQYAISALVDRDGTDAARIVQRGSMSVQLFPVVFASPVADGTWLADGTLYADGFGE